MNPALLHAMTDRHHCMVTLTLSAIRFTQQRIVIVLWHAQATSSKATHSPAQKHNLLCNFSGRYEAGLSKLANELSSLHLAKVIQRACLEHRRIDCARRDTEHIHPCGSTSNSVCHAQRLTRGQAESSWTGHTILALDISQRHTCLFKLSQKFAGSMHLANSRPQHSTC